MVISTTLFIFSHTLLLHTTDINERDKVYCMPKKTKRYLKVPDVLKCNSIIRREPNKTLFIEVVQFVNNTQLSCNGAEVRLL